jgi:hypothetical protein
MTQAKMPRRQFESIGGATRAMIPVMVVPGRTGLKGHEGNHPFILKEARRQKTVWCDAATR